MSKLQLTLALLKPSTVSRPHAVEGIVRMIQDDGLYIVRNKLMTLDRDCALKFYQEHDGKFFYNRLVTYMSSGPMIAMALAGTDAIPRWRSLMGPTKVYKTQYEVPGSIRAQFGISDTRNATHGSDSEISSRNELAFFFPEFDIKKWYNDEEPCFREENSKVFYDEESGIHVCACDEV